MDDFFRDLPKHEQHKTLSLHNCLRPCSTGVRNLWRTACDVTFYDSQIIYSVPAKALRTYLKIRCIRIVTESYIKTYGIKKLREGHICLTLHQLMYDILQLDASPMRSYTPTIQYIQFHELLNLLSTNHFEISRCLELIECEDEIAKLCMDVAVYAREKKWAKGSDTRFYVDD